MHRTSGPNQDQCAKQHGKTQNDHGLTTIIMIMGLALSSEFEVRLHNINTMASAAAHTMLMGVIPTKYAIAMPVAADKTCPLMKLCGSANGELANANAIKQLTP